MIADCKKRHLKAALDFDFGLYRILTQVHIPFHYYAKYNITMFLFWFNRRIGECIIYDILSIRY